MSFISSQIKDSSVYDYLADQAADEIEVLEKQEGELRDHIKQLEQQLAEVKKSIKSVIQHYEDGEVYFERNYEAFYTDSFQDLMVDIYKKHDEADLVSQTHRPTNLNSFIQKHVHREGNDAWTYNSLARSAQDFIDSAVEAFESQAQQAESKILSFDENGQLVDKSHAQQSQAARLLLLKLEIEQICDDVKYAKDAKLAIQKLDFSKAASLPPAPEGE